MARACWSAPNERKKKSIGNRRPCGAAGEQMKHPMQDGQIPVGGDHVHLVRFDLRAIFRLLNSHRRRALKQLDQHALVRRIEMLDHDERQAALVRHMAKERIERFEPTGRRTDAHDVE